MYFDYSIKSDTRQKRIGVFQRSHTLSLKTPLPAKEICMSSAKTKENLIEIIATVLLDSFTEKKLKQKLVVTSKSKFPEETSEGTRIKRTDLKTLFDEADYIIPQQVESAIQNGSKVVKVVCADTDVFVLLCAMYANRGWWEAEVYMEDFKGEKNMISIRQTVEKHCDLVNSLISVHALTGCDTVPMMVGIGKTKSINIVSKQPLKFLGQTNADITSVLQEGKSFVAQCYGLNETDCSKNRCV